MNYRHVLFLIFCLSLNPLAWGEDKPEEEVANSALSWLHLVDQGKYGESWDAGAKSMQGMMDRGARVKLFKFTRKPLGEVLVRRVKSVEAKTSLPGRPDGKYVVFQFDTTFLNQQSVYGTRAKEKVRYLRAETITVMLEEDGSWKVSDYLMVPRQE